MESNTEVQKKYNDDYYLKPVKFVRDLVLGYVYLTEFDIKIIDTLEFQRLKDIRQLTCQQVFPSARHTRFEHSLGVMELTRQALKNLNRNGFISETSIDNIKTSGGNEKIFNKQLQFNAALAALLHDVGHCPFSHLGEAEMKETEVWNKLYECVNNHQELRGSTLRAKFDKANEEITNDSKAPKGFGSKHEQLSCIVILEKFTNELLKVRCDKIKKFDDGSDLKVDFELIIRSILGLKYKVSSSDEFKKNKEKNVIVNLINSRIFDLDKLDYVMRDSWFTGIGAPKVDTHRLFRNMYLNNENEYSLVFTNRAVPSLQNMIESRDELYMYVYNHHTSVFSDFMFSYIFRRLTHNDRDFKKIKTSNQTAGDGNDEKNGKRSINTSKEFDYLGFVPKEYLFSPSAILNYNRSDSDFISLLNSIWNYLSEDGNIDKVKELLRGKIEPIEEDSEKMPQNQHEGDIEKLDINIKRTYNLICNYQRRAYLKPWWKTSSEFNNFIKTNFRDDRVREKLCNWICHDDGDLKSDEFRSQLAKNVSYITRELKKDIENDYGLIEQFENDEFFVIQRSSHFFDPETIGELDIALKSNEILGSPGDVKSCSGNFYIKSLTNVIPQRDYYSMYAENSFYIFSKPLGNENGEDTESENKEISAKRSRHYHFIEQIFVFVATTIINDGIRAFQENYKDANAEEDAHKKMFERFVKQYPHM